MSTEGLLGLVAEMDSMVIPTKYTPTKIRIVCLSTITQSQKHQNTALVGQGLHNHLYKASAHTQYHNITASNLNAKPTTGLYLVLAEVAVR